MLGHPGNLTRPYMSELRENRRHWEQNVMVGKIPKLYQGKRTLGKYHNTKERRKDIRLYLTSHQYDIIE
jgi:hypothetical protein